MLRVSRACCCLMICCTCSEPLLLVDHSATRGGQWPAACAGGVHLMFGAKAAQSVTSSLCVIIGTRHMGLLRCGWLGAWKRRCCRRAAAAAAALALPGPRACQRMPRRRTKHHWRSCAPWGAPRCAAPAVRNPRPGSPFSLRLLCMPHQTLSQTARLSFLTDCMATHLLFARMPHDTPG